MMITVIVGALLLQPPLTSSSLAELDRETSGRLGVAITDGTRFVTNRGQERFSLQSVMKLIVAMATFDAIDKGKFSLETKSVIAFEDRSIGVQSLAERVAPGKTTSATVRELIELAVQESDSMATDFLIGKLGGVRVVQDFLKKHQIAGVRIDRTERILQCETVGLKWKPAFLQNGEYEKHLGKLSPRARTSAQKQYMSDPRDTATPIGFANLLSKLVQKRLLSASSTEELLNMMEGTKTYPQRLANSIPARWKFGHKTGSSGTWNGLAVATNDVGIARDSTGSFRVVVVFLGDAKGDMDSRNATIAKVPSVSGLF